MDSRQSFSSVAVQSAVTQGSVVPGMGYPADRQEQSPHPTGWQGAGLAGLESIEPSVGRTASERQPSGVGASIEQSTEGNVSRETI